MSVTKELKTGLEVLNFDVDSPAAGLLFVEKSYESDEISFGERLALEDAVRYKANAVYFRRFEKQESQPQLFIFDNTSGEISEEELGEIHKKIWTSSVVPLYYVFDKTSLRVFDAKNPVDKNDLIPRPLDKAVDLVSAAHKDYERFSAKLFENCLFWEQECMRGHFKNENSSSRDLIKGLKNCKTKFSEVFGKKQRALANKLLVQSILVKYLEERRDEKGKAGYKPNFFLKYCGEDGAGFCGAG